MYNQSLLQAINTDFDTLRISYREVEELFDTLRLFLYETNIVDFERDDYRITGRIFNENTSKISYRIVFNGTEVFNSLGFLNTTGGYIDFDIELPFNDTINNNRLGIFHRNEEMPDFVEFVHWFLSPNDTPILEEGVVFSNRLSGTIIDPDDDRISYRVTLDGRETLPWTPFRKGPINVNVTWGAHEINQNRETLAEIQIRVEMKDHRGASSVFRFMIPPVRLLKTPPDVYEDLKRFFPESSLRIHHPAQLTHFKRKVMEMANMAENERQRETYNRILGRLKIEEARWRRSPQQQ